MTNESGLREKIARLIDPTAFEPMTGHVPLRRQADALANAERVIALISPAGGVGGLSVPGTPDVNERMLFWAFRYTLGRMSYAVSDVADEIIRRAPTLSLGNRNMILAEIGEARAADRLGMACDAQSWEAVERSLSAAPRGMEG